jgi:hypothetical protein
LCSSRLTVPLPLLLLAARQRTLSGPLSP